MLVTKQNLFLKSGSLRDLRSNFVTFVFTLLVVFLSACSSSHPDPNTITVLIEFSPNNLDPRIGTDAQSERIDELLFDSLVKKDEHFNLQPWVAEKWEIADPLTYIFHLHRGIRFHDGRPLTARDVKWTIDSMIDGTVVSSKTATTSYQHISSIEARDDQTVIFHMKEPDSGLLWNLSDGAMGIVPYGSDKTFNVNPVGSGPFKFVRNEQDNEVIIARNDDYWADKPKLERVRFAVVPDSTTRALELRKGSADIEINALTADMVGSLRGDRSLVIEQAPGTAVQYLGFNLRDPILADVRIRQAIAYAIDLRPIIDYLWRDTVRPTASVIPLQHWAYDTNLKPYPHDLHRARELLQQAGYSVEPGRRLRLVMKISTTEEASRLLAVILQQQLHEIGIDLEIRTFEFATFYADVVHGVFQIYTLRWVGGSNQDPEVFEYILDSKSFAPRRANRSYYSNPQVDAWIEQAREELDQNKRKEIYAKIQEEAFRDLPSLNLWSLDNVIVHTKRVQNVHPEPAGNYDFLRVAEITQ
jgi:peptide/nickel transport system substrate-binding protein